MKSSDNQEIYTSSTKMYVTGSELRAQVCSLTKNLFRKGDELTLLFAEPQQVSLISGEAVPANEIENIDLRKTFVTITLADADIHSRDTALVNDCFRIVRERNSVTAIAKKDIQLTNKTLLLQVTLRKQFSNRTLLTCQGLEKSDKTYISMPCDVSCEPRYWTVIYYLNDGSKVQQVVTDEKELKKTLDVYKADILRILTSARLRLIPIKNIKEIEIVGDSEVLKDMDESIDRNNDGQSHE